MSRYFASVFDEDGRFYVFDEDNAGDECAGPFDTQEQAEAEAERMNDEVAADMEADRLLEDARQDGPR